MTTRRTFTATSAALALALTCLGVQANGNIAGQLNAQMVLQAGCYITGSATQNATGLNFGTLDFGSQPSTFTGVLTAAASGGEGGAGATQITCSPDITALTVTVNGGNNAGQGSQVGTGARAMKFGSSYLPYEVYSDAALSTPYPTSSSLGVVLPGTGAAVALPVFGRVNKTSTNALQSGTYVDVLQVTLSW